MMKLKPCPFCGGEARTYTASAGKNKPKAWFVHCDGCRMNYPNWYCTIEAEAIEAWNRREGE